MHSQDKIDQLFQTLRDSEPGFTDNGFSNAVMEKVSKQSEKRQAKMPSLATWKKNTISMSFTGLGSGLAASLLPLDSIPVNQTIQQLINQLFYLETFALAGVLFFALSMTLLWQEIQSH